MNKVAAIVLTVLASLNTACSIGSDDHPLHDRIRTAAQELRWTKGTETRASVTLSEFRRPVLVLALPPGKYAAVDLDPLVREAEGKQWLKQWIQEQTLEPSEPSIYVSQPGGRAQTSLYYDQISIPRPLGLWKQDEGPLDVSLRRENDAAQIIGIR